MHPGVYAREAPDRPAVIVAATGQVVSYRELDEQANRAARLLADLGLRPGDHVAYQVDNRAELFDLIWAAHRSGLWYTLVSTRLGPDETAYIVNDSGAKVLIASSTVTSTLEQLDPFSTPRVKARFVLEGGSLPSGADPGWQPWEPAVAAYSTAPIDGMMAGDDLLYSSGTTGRPKGVERLPPSRSLDTLDGLSQLTQVVFGFGPGTRYLSPAPLYHAAPLRFTRSVQRLGGAVILMDHFEPGEFLDLIGRFEVNATQVVPTMFIRMLRLDEQRRAAANLSSMRTAIHASAPCPVAVKQQMLDWWGPVIWEYYAGTEGNGITVCSPQDWLTHRGSVGRPIATRVHILDDTGQELPPGQQGMVYLESAEQFRYRNDPDKTASSHTPGGWGTLGDIGYLDAEGFLYLTDRKADLIISGGVNIYPREVEDTLIMHPSVGDVAVFGVPHEEMGEEVKAVVQPVEGVDPSPALEAELLAFCRSQLAHFKCPRSIDFIAELPRHPTGKLYKRVLKDRYWAGRGGRI